MIPNYDKIFPPKVEISSGFFYIPSDNIEQELSYTLELSGFREMLNMMRESLLKKIDEEYGLEEDDVERIYKMTDPEQIREVVIKIYSKHLTLDEAKILNKQYLNPEYRKILDKLPKILEEVMLNMNEYLKSEKDKLIERINKRKG